MEALYLLIPISTVLVFLAIWVFVRASDSGQFDDMVGPAMRILLDDDSARPPVKNEIEAASDSGSFN
ncbi:cytochrome oxidase maturation protein, cbb3-type [Collimonas sp. OK307]|uniref:cbb3-type cytochrome oxidase assembly protein CcoS n=1 Tax=Collimonas sp. OK307 TaxID=1801620 RepID=UPI0008E587B2|nr:cbb3-type cytochrome oxidase assembly protein CcoS [Collimonas sp. OK307]SFI35744.1 cytochrome oxidase maturation protein, cbb3-type [Collimonas sp. OK307]